MARDRKELPVQSLWGALPQSRGLEGMSPPPEEKNAFMPSWPKSLMAKGEFELASYEEPKLRQKWNEKKKVKKQNKKKLQTFPTDKWILVAPCMVQGA